MATGRSKYQRSASLLLCPAPIPVPNQGVFVLRKLVLTTMAIFFAIAILGQTAQAAHNWYRMVYACEARGIRNPWYANTGNGFYFGPQFTHSTWHASGGGPVREMGDRYGRPMSYYSVGYIIGVAERTLRTQGYRAWPNCYYYL